MPGEELDVAPGKEIDAPELEKRRVRSAAVAREARRAFSPCHHQPVSLSWGIKKPFFTES